MKNRDILFRVWDNGQMYYLYDGKANIIIRNGGYVILEENFGIPFNNHQRGLDDAVLMQYVGLNDKNEKRIYEGDIVRFWTQSTRSTKNGIKRLVEYQNGLLLPFYDDEYIQDEQGDWFHTFSGEPDKVGFEVIGNIYENPEILQ